MPTCSRISQPPAARSVTACRAAATVTSSPSHGAHRVSPVGSIATPSPSMRAANTSSGTSSSGVLQPASGAGSTRGVALMARAAPSRSPTADRGRAERSAGTARGVPARVRQRDPGQHRHRVVVRRGRERQDRERCALAAIGAHLELAGGGVRRIEADGVAVAADLEVERHLSDGDGERARRVRSAAGRIQQGFSMSMRNTARAPTRGASSSRPAPPCRCRS